MVSPVSGSVAVPLSMTVRPSGTVRSWPASTTGGLLPASIRTVAGWTGLPAASYTAAIRTDTAEGAPPSVSRWVAFSCTSMVPPVAVGWSIWASVTLAEGPTRDSSV